MDGYARLLSEPSNFAIVQLPGRNYPGVVFQADSLHGLLYNVTALQRLAAKFGDAKLSESIEEIQELLSEVEGSLVYFCGQSGIDLPFRLPDRIDE